MANNADNIQTARPLVDGVAFVADKGAQVPTSATADKTGFNSLGYVSEDGLTLTVARSKQDIKEMGGSTALTIQTEHSVQIKLKPLEWNTLVKKELFGSNNVDASGNVTINGDEVAEKPFVFDMRGRDNSLIRVVAPRMKLAEHGDLVFKSGDTISAEITYDCLPDDKGNKAYIYGAEEV